MANLEARQELDSHVLNSDVGDYNDIIWGSEIRIMTANTSFTPLFIHSTIYVLRTNTPPPFDRTA